MKTSCATVALAVDHHQVDEPALIGASGDDVACILGGDTDKLRGRLIPTEDLLDVQNLSLDDALAELLGELARRRAVQIHPEVLEIHPLHPVPWRLHDLLRLTDRQAYCQRG